MKLGRFQIRRIINSVLSEGMINERKSDMGKEGAGSGQKNPGAESKKFFKDLSTHIKRKKKFDHKKYLDSAGYHLAYTTKDDAAYYDDVYGVAVRDFSDGGEDARKLINNIGKLVYRTEYDDIDPENVTDLSLALSDLIATKGDTIKRHRKKSGQNTYHPRGLNPAPGPGGITRIKGKTLYIDILKNLKAVSEKMSLLSQALKSERAEEEAKKEAEAADKRKKQIEKVTAGDYSVQGYKLGGRQDKALTIFRKDTQTDPYLYMLHKVYDKGNAFLMLIGKINPKTNKFTMLQDRAKRRFKGYVLKKASTRPEDAPLLELVNDNFLDYRTNAFGEKLSMKSEEKTPTKKIVLVNPPKKTVSEGLSRGSLYRRRYHGRY